MIGLIVGVIIALVLAWADPKLRDLTDIDLRGLRVVRPPGGRIKEGTELPTVLARRILGESQVDPRLVAITSPGAVGDVKAAQQVAVALAQAAAASGLTVAILSATRKSGAQPRRRRSTSRCPPIRSRALSLPRESSSSACLLMRWSAAR